MKHKAWLTVLIPGVLALVVGVFFMALLVIKLVWPWAIPDLFPGAVEQGLIARELSWYTTFKLAVFVAVFAGISSIFHGRESS